jgi:hypothetical protein
VILTLGFLNSCLSYNPRTGTIEFGTGPTESESSRRKKITSAIDKASSELMGDLPNNSKIAVLGGNIAGNDEQIVVDYYKSLGYSESQARAAVKGVDKQQLPVLAAQIKQQKGGNSSGYDEYVIEDLEYNLVKSGKFKLVDRQQIETILSEQNFQTSGNVDDNSAVNIGKIAGASIVITISITTADNSGRITLKALDVKTAEIITMARSEY